MRKNQDISRLHANKIEHSLRKIETLEANKPHVQYMLDAYTGQHYPGVVLMHYVRETHCLNIKYIGLAVQWYAHLNRAIIHHGNEKPRREALTGEQLRSRLLHQGKKGFM